MSINSRNKGKVGEREWAAWLTANGFPAKRGCQNKGGVDSPDVEGGIRGVHFEVKRVENLNIHNAIAQAVKDAGDEAIPVVAHRRNRGAWLVTLRAEDLERLVEAVLTAKSKSGSVVVDALRNILDNPTGGTMPATERAAAWVKAATPPPKPKECGRCDGSGRDYDSDFKKECSECGGSGMA